MSKKDYQGISPTMKEKLPSNLASKSPPQLRRQNRKDDIQYNKYKFAKNNVKEDNVDPYDMEVGNSDDVITIPVSNMVLETHQSKASVGDGPMEIKELDLKSSSDEYEMGSENLHKNNNPHVSDYQNKSEDYVVDPNYGCNRDETEGENPGTGDFRNEFDDEYIQNEEIAVPASTIANRGEQPNHLQEKLAKYKTTKGQKTNPNTIGEALTYFKSGDHSESINRSPNLVLPSSNVKTYVLNKSCKVNSNLNKSDVVKDSLLARINKNLSERYMTSKDFYNVKIINDIIYNENTHIVSVFKDYLILDDISEFLKRRYASFETKPRLTKIYEFYDKYSKVFPNYVVLPENKYMFKNIERKQRMIDEKQKYKSDKERKQKEKEEKANNFGGFSNLMDSDDSTDRLFDTKFVDDVKNINPYSLYNSINSDNMSKHSQFLDHEMNSSILSQHSNIQAPTSWQKMQDICNQSGIASTQIEVPLDQLVEDFIEKDSEMSNSYIVDKSLDLDTSNSQHEEKKRKVKRVDYTLKITSNDIERNQPKKETTKDSLLNKPKTYKIPTSKERLSVGSSHSGLGQFGRKKNSSQNKRLTNQDIFGTSNSKVLKTQRYEKTAYNTSNSSNLKGMYQSKSTSNIKTVGKSKPHTKNFQILSNKRSAFDPIRGSKTSLPTSKETISYKTKPKEEKSHHRGETWTANQYLSMK